MTAALHVLYLQLSPPPPSSLAPKKNRDNLVPANTGPTGKMALKNGKREPC